MRSGKSLIGLLVMGKAEGTYLGHVRDLIFDQDANQVMALVLGEEDLFGLIEARVVPWREVHSVGKQVVMVKDDKSVLLLREDEQLRKLATTRRDTVLSGTRILTSDGRHLGTLADLIVEESSGHIAGYEVSGGFISDTMHGKKLLPGSTHISLGQDAAIVPSEAAEAFQKACLGELSLLERCVGIGQSKGRTSIEFRPLLFPTDTVFALASTFNGPHGFVAQWSISRLPVRLSNTQNRVRWAILAKR